MSIDIILCFFVLCYCKTYICNYIVLMCINVKYVCCGCVSEWVYMMSEWVYMISEWVYMMSEWMYMMSECSVYDEWMQWVHANIWMFSVYGECRVNVGVVDCKTNKQRGFAGPGWGSGTFWDTGSLSASFWAVGSTCPLSWLTAGGELDLFHFYQ